MGRAPVGGRRPGQHDARLHPGALRRAHGDEERASSRGDGPRATTPDDLSIDEWHQGVAINLNGAFYCLSHAFRLMRAQTPQGGRIINNGSISAYAPRPGSIAYTATKQAVSGLPLSVHGDGLQSRCFCNVKDTVRAVMALSAHPGAVGEIYNVGSQHEITILDLARRIIARAGSQSDIKLIPYAQAYAAGFEDMRRRIPGIDKIHAAIGWRPAIELDQTLDEVIAETRAQLAQA